MHSSSPDSLASFVRAQEDERRRIARELHDGLSQQLAVLVVELSRLRDMIDPSGTDARNQVDVLRAQADEMMRDVRAVSHQLHPATLEHLGLAGAIRSHCRQFVDHDNIPVDLSIPFRIDSVNRTISLSLYRILQEALRNSARHSAATQIWVRLVRTGSRLQLRITDNGIGFEPESAQLDGIGLTSMEERARLIGASLRIASAPGCGTTVEVEVPLSPTNESKENGKDFHGTPTHASRG